MGFEIFRGVYSGFVHIAALRLQRLATYIGLTPTEALHLWYSAPMLI